LAFNILTPATSASYSVKNGLAAAERVLALEVENEITSKKKMPSQKILLIQISRSKILTLSMKTKLF
jgi:hypothetical protein